MKFSEVLRKLRIQKGITQEELAKNIDSKVTTISSWESSHRKPDINTVITIAEYFGVSVDYLLGLTDESNPLRKRFFTGRELAHKLTPEQWEIDPIKDLDYIELIEAMEEEEVTPKMLLEYIPVIVKLKKQFELDNK